MYTSFSFKYTNEYDTLYMLHPYLTSDFKNPPFELITEIASYTLELSESLHHSTEPYYALLIENIELFSASLRIMTL